METYNNFNEAKEAAQLFFSENFNYNDGVGVESANNDVIEFYSKNDPAMSDTFTCIINDGYSYSCKNGELKKVSNE